MQSNTKKNISIVLENVFEETLVPIVNFVNREREKQTMSMCTLLLI